MLWLSLLRFRSDVCLMVSSSTSGQWEGSLHPARKLEVLRGARDSFALRCSGFFRVWGHSGFCKGSRHSVACIANLRLHSWMQMILERNLRASACQSIPCLSNVTLRGIEVHTSGSSGILLTPYAIAVRPVGILRPNLIDRLLRRSIP